MMIVVGIVLFGIVCAIAVITLSIVRVAQRKGHSVELVMLAVLVGGLLVVNLGFDPAAAECPPKYTGHSTWQGPPLRCSASRALGLTMGGGATAIAKTVRLLTSGELNTSAGWTALTTDVTRAVKYLSPMIAGFIFSLALCLGIAKPFGTNGATRTYLLLWTEGMLVALAGLGTLPWALGVILAYIGTVVWPVAVLQLWLLGLAIGMVGAVSLTVKTVMSARSQFTGERTIPQSN